MPAGRLTWVLLASLVALMAHATRAVAQVDSVAIIDEVDITGNRSFPKSDLMRVIESRESSWFKWLPGIDPRPVVRSRVRTDLLRLASFYKDEGFLDVSVDTLIERQSSGYRVAFLISEGEPVVVDSVRIRGGEQLAGLERLELKTQPGLRLTRANLEDDRLRILGTLRDSGYAFAAVDLTTALHPSGREVFVDVQVQPGNRYRFGDVIVRGNENVGAPTIKRGVTFRPGANFDQRHVRSARRQLYRSGAFRSVTLDFPDTLASDSTVSTVVTVSERSLRSVKMGAGYDTQSQINGTLSWIHRSAFGGAQQFRIVVQASAILSEVRANLTQPYVFGSRNWTNFGVFARSSEKGDFGQTVFGGNISFERNIATRTTLLFETSGGVVDKADSLFAEFVTQFVDDHRDDFLDPTEGVFVRLEARQRGALLRSDLELLQLTGEGRWYSKLPLQSVLATRVFSGVIVNLRAGGDIPNFDRFFAGGLSSIRGWPQDELGPKDRLGNPVGGKSKVEASIEVRTQFGKYVGTAVFLDAGNVHPEFSAFDVGQFRWAVGGGLRFLSPVGPVRLDAGRRLNDDNTALWQYHFSIGQAF